MSAYTETFPRTLQSLLILGLIALGATPSPLHAERTCASTIPLAAGETWRDPGSDAGDGACFGLDLDAAGVLMLEASTAATAARVRLSLEKSVPAVTRLQQSATSLVLAAPAGSYRLRLEAEDPRQPLPPFTLRSRFLAVAKGETDSETEIDPDPIVAPPADKGETDSETEIDPDPIVAPPGTKGETDSETEIDPDPIVAPPRFPSLGRCVKGETDSETEIDPDPIVGGPAPSLYDLSAPPLGSRLAALCRQGESDDHGDGFACATPLVWGREATGEIGNGWGDDGDVFRFRVRALGAVEIQAGGVATEARHRTQLELVAELYDRHGQRLDLAVGDGDGLRRVRTLAPGTYFLRLEGRDGAAGRYSTGVGPPSR